MERSVLCLLIVALVLVDLLSAQIIEPAPKPGTCPADPCKRCRSDRECGRSEKCCPNDCIGNTCKLTYGGPCPPVRASEKCFRECFSDWQCLGDLKCCSKDCRKQCVKPEGRPCNECDTDRDCKGRKKCCFDGCDKLCKDTRGGPCPPPLRWPCFDQCENDDDCKRCLKCELVGCWKRCVKPEKLPVKRPCDECAWDCDCKNEKGHKCCFDGCKWTCMRTTGACPPPRPGLPCDKCRTDRDCPRCEKCRFTGCWKECVPELPKPGSCPRLFKMCKKCSTERDCLRGQRCCDDGCGFKRCQYPPEGDCRRAQSQCCKDCDCKGALKCCFNGCGNYCVKPQIGWHVGPRSSA